MTFLGVILWEKLIARIPEARKFLFDLDLGKGSVFWSENLKVRFLVFPLNQDQGSVFTVWECAQLIPRLEKPKNRRFSYKNLKMFDFRFNTPILSLNQGQGSVFTRWRYAQSIFTLFLALEGHFSKKFFGERALICTPLKGPWSRKICPKKLDNW